MIDFYNSRVYVAGHTGLVGSALWNRLKIDQYEQLIDPELDGIKPDLRNQVAVDDFFMVNKPEYVFLVAARVGGIQANIDRPAEFIYDNLLIQSNVMEAARKHNVKKLLFLGSSCIYPREAPQPMKEEYLLSGPMEPTNKPYALAKIAGIQMCNSYNRQYGTNFIALMPPNLYGPGDNFTDSGHVMAALIKKFHKAKVAGDPSVTLWGTGDARREFLYVNDLASAMIHAMQYIDADVDAPFYNVGSGGDITIWNLAILIAAHVGYEGEILWDETKPEGMPRKLLDSTKFQTYGHGWYPWYDLNIGIARTYEWYVKSLEREHE